MASILNGVRNFCNQKKEELLYIGSSFVGTVGSVYQFRSITFIASQMLGCLKNSSFINQETPRLICLMGQELDRKLNLNLPKDEQISAAVHVFVMVTCLKFVCQLNPKIKKEGSFVWNRVKYGLGCTGNIVAQHMQVLSLGFLLGDFFDCSNQISSNSICSLKQDFNNQLNLYVNENDEFTKSSLALITFLAGFALKVVSKSLINRTTQNLSQTLPFVDPSLEKSG